ncbi:hypothetical protein HYV80_02930 [Candidatus Woesearchaeota archaeon]|nr:hypothetical protein [Candidatus Woesearchaeota archaeon]
MNKINVIALALVMVVLLSITALSQLSPIIDTKSKTTQVTPTISLEEKDTCITTFYNEVQNVYSNCIHYLNSTGCLNTTGPNTDCSVTQSQINYSCKTGEITAAKNTTECSSNKFIVSIGKVKKEVDFSSWGVCVNSTENNCLAITCGTLKGGSARNGIFNGCDGGKSCQKFLFCEDSTRVLYKASRSDFIYEDPTFHLSKLAYQEVTQ